MLWVGYAVSNNVLGSYLFINDKFLDLISQRKLVAWLYLVVYIKCCIEMLILDLDSFSPHKSNRKCSRIHDGRDIKCVPVFLPAPLKKKTGSILVGTLPTKVLKMGMRNLISLQCCSRSDTAVVHRGNANLALSCSYWEPEFWAL